MGTYISSQRFKIKEKMWETWVFSVIFRMW